VSPEFDSCTLTLWKDLHYKKLSLRECITSPAVIINLTWVNSGKITLLSTSNILNPPFSKSDSGTIYESNSINSSSVFKKSGYW